MERSQGAQVGADERSSSRDSASAVLVTGATGFIGRALCRALATEGHEVWALSRTGDLPEGAAHALACDVTDPRALRAAIARSRPSRAYHLAARVTSSRDLAAVRPTFETKLASTVTLLEATQTLEDCRVILAGSLEEPEATPRSVPLSPYAAATAAATAYGAMFHTLYDRAVVSARIFMAYGPGESNTSRVIPSLIRQHLRGATPDLRSPTRAIDWIYIDDLVEGLLRLGQPSAPRGGSFDLGSGSLATVQEVSDRIATLVALDRLDPPVDSAPPGDPESLPRPDRSRDVARFPERVRCADVEDSYARLGWRAKTPLGEGLHRTIESLRARPRASIPRA